MLSLKEELARKATFAIEQEKQRKLEKIKKWVDEIMDRLPEELNYQADIGRFSYSWKDEGPYYESRYTTLALALIKFCEENNLELYLNPKVKDLGMIPGFSYFESSKPEMFTIVWGRV